MTTETKTPTHFTADKYYEQNVRNPYSDESQSATAYRKGFYEGWDAVFPALYFHNVNLSNRVMALEKENKQMAEQLAAIKAALK
jgi:hypothetical protein